MISNEHLPIRFGTAETGFHFQERRLNKPVGNLCRCHGGGTSSAESNVAG